MDRSVNFTAKPADLLLIWELDLKDKYSYDKNCWSDNSGFEIGQTSPLVLLYQEAIKTPVTGTWTEEDENQWKLFTEKQNWKILFKFLQPPSLWDVGNRKDDILLNLEF